MVSRIDKMYSHPDKLLVAHLDGVSQNVRLLTDSKIAELLAVFHDVGKLNPNFQRKLKGERLIGYSNHAYISAYSFFCLFVVSKYNRDLLKNHLGWNEVTENDIIAISVLIAKHHGNIPDFMPQYGDSILSRMEVEQMLSSLEKIACEIEPLIQYCIGNFQAIENSEKCFSNRKLSDLFLDRFVFQYRKNNLPLDFFIGYQFAFACLIQSDKLDAANIYGFIEEGQKNVEEFSSVFVKRLDAKLNSLNQDTQLNRIRTQMRKEAIDNLIPYLSEGKRVYNLTSPTGSGKTYILLSLAAEIIKRTGAKRIIYSLPFLSITEQVESVVKDKDLFEDCESCIQRIDSKSSDKEFMDLLKAAEKGMTEEQAKRFEILDFKEQTFSYPFVITTFVQFFETLLSNRNADLMKLPNFSNCIFLLDEIQSLPPRLYGFFVAYITKFCEKFNSYAIISTATQPEFSLPVNNQIAKEFFSDYQNPEQLLPLSFFEEEVFNRYKIIHEEESMEIENLAEKIICDNNSVLVILNTIDDTKELYGSLIEHLPSASLLLLNTHFTTKDRQKKIEIAKDKLKNNERVILISTQLIEAGVDIDFPVVYRDFSTIASLVQSAGRCNRNGKLASKGVFHVIHLYKGKQERASLIYRGKDSELLRFTKGAFVRYSSDCYENEFFAMQELFFKLIQSELHFAKHWKETNQDDSHPDWDFIDDIKRCMYDKIGQFRLIEENVYGKIERYYVAEDDNDENFEQLIELQKQLIELLKKNSDIREIKLHKKKIETHLKKMANQIVQVRLKTGQSSPLRSSDKNYFDLYKICSLSYTFNEGVKFDNCII